MQINGKDISIWKAKLLDLSIGSSSRDLKYEFLNDRNLTPARTKNGKYGYMPMELKFEIYAGSRTEFESLKSSLIGELSESTIEIDSIPGKIYSGYLKDDPEIEEKAANIGTVKVKLSVICEAFLVTRTFTDSITFAYEGNTEAPAVLEITPSVSLTTLTISGLTKGDIVVTNVSKDAPLIIDGESCLITQSGSNKFGDATLWEFPSVKPGNNSVTLSTACATILKYKPRFI